MPMSPGDVMVVNPAYGKFLSSDEITGMVMVNDGSADWRTVSIPLGHPVTVISVGMMMTCKVTEARERKVQVLFEGQLVDVFVMSRRHTLAPPKFIRVVL